MSVRGPKGRAWRPDPSQPLPVTPEAEELTAGHPHALSRQQFEHYATRAGRKPLGAGDTIVPCDGSNCCRGADDEAPCYGWQVVRA